MREIESAYLLEYEKQKMRVCAKSFEELANVFVYFPPKEIAENEEVHEEDRRTLIWKKRFWENRELFADNLRELAGIMEAMAGSEVRAISFSERRYKKLAKLLEEEGLILQDIYILESGNEKELLGVQIRCKKDKICTSEDLAGYLSVLLNRHYRAVNGMPFFISKEFETLYYEEEPKLLAMSGYAKAIKESEKISGDNYSFFETSNDSYVAILSDGMGSGEKACADSEAVVEMAEKFLEAGFSVEMTVQMINDVLLLNCENTNMSTLDLCCVDLMTGNARLAKIGSASTYIKNLNHVEKIPAESLPLGIFHNQELQIIKKEIQSGDYVIMLSDGIADCIAQEKGEAFIESLISELQCERPAEMAGRIMKYVLGISKGHIQDDMTVLVIGFWENRYED